MDKWIIEIPEQYLPAIADLPGDLSMIAAHAEEYFPGQGRQIALVISQTCSGWVYFRKMDKLYREWRDDIIRELYAQGVYNARQLARIFGLSESSIEKILASLSRKEKAALQEKQLKLF